MSSKKHHPVSNQYELKFLEVRPSEGYNILFKNELIILYFFKNLKMKICKKFLVLFVLQTFYFLFIQLHKPLMI
ncbi:MAG: hypothetical protein CM1200mP28_12320 [Deltaproteobacteria bacterium]|nr:MAG: hypothetical protein CM1200mP28_12320 [Deltaproteobacteria bacterium]